MSRKLGEVGEFLLIFVCAFALPILASLQVALSSEPRAVSTGADFIGLLAYECLALAVLSTILWIRGWRPSQLGLTPQRSDIPVAFLLLATFYMSFWLILAVAQSLGADVQPWDKVVPIEKGFGLPLIVAISVINAIFEEVFVCGYTITALSRIKGPWLAINVSIAIRLAYHLYQGNIAVMSILPMGFIGALWFVRTGRLWPLIIAHAVADFMSLYEFA